MLDSRTAGPSCQASGPPVRKILSENENLITIPEDEQNGTKIQYPGENNEMAATIVPRCTQRNRAEWKNVKETRYQQNSPSMLRKKGCMKTWFFIDWAEKNFKYVATFGNLWSLADCHLVITRKRHFRYFRTCAIRRLLGPTFSPNFDLFLTSVQGRIHVYM